MHRILHAYRLSLALAFAFGTFVAGPASNAADTLQLAPVPAPMLPRLAPPPSNSPPDLVLTGIVELFATKRAFLIRTEYGQPIGSYTLKEGEKRDGVEVLAIDARAETVSVRNAGVDMLLSLKTHSPTVVERQLLAERSMVSEHVSAHELREQRERIRIARERAEAEQLLREPAEILLTK